MLRGIRNASSNWLGKAVLTVVMGLLVISFAIWGIGDIFRGFGRATLAKVGSTEISIEQFRQAYNDRLQQISRRTGRPITPEQARAVGLDQQVVGQLIAEAALDERIRQLGLNLSNTEIARQIMADPTFRGPTGQFDRVRFEQLIRNSGYNEARFTAEQRRLALRRQLAETVTAGPVVPQTAVQTMNRYENERRAIEYVTVTGDQAGEMPAPTPEALRKYYEERKATFRAPEYRKITFLSLTPAELAPWISVSEDDVKRVYEERRSRYVVPERRAIQQIVFANEAEAKAAAERLAGGLTFAQLAAERKLSEKDIDLGLVAKSALVDGAVADAAFSLKEGETSAPVAGRFGTALVHVSKIEPEQARPLAEVAPEIRNEIALDRARTELHDRHDKIEDERASGLRLSEVAQKLGMQAQTIEAIDRSGRTPDGDLRTDLPRVNLLPSAFASQPGVENDPLEVPGGGFVWYEVESVQPSRERDFEEVKSLVEERWRADQAAEAVKARAKELLDKAKAGTPLADIAAQIGGQVQSVGDLTRRRTRGNFPAKAIEDVFRAEKGAVALAEGDKPAEQILFRVTDVSVPPLDPASEDGKRLVEEVRRSMSDDLLSQYIARLQNELGTNINAEAVRQVVGGERN